MRGKGWSVFPDVYVDYHLLDDQLILQTSATGGDRFSSFSGRFFSRPFTYEGEFGHALERVRTMIGARGSIAGRFRYDFQGGYARWAHSVLDGMSTSSLLWTPATSTAIVTAFIPAQYDYAYNLLFAELDYGWNSESVTVDGRLAYHYTNITGNGAFTPAAFTGFIRPAYNWGGRLKAGLEASWSTDRKALVAVSEGMPISEYRLPGWVDLGVFAEYRFTHRFGFWAKGGNLLNQAVQRIPLVAEAGMYFTAGIVLNF